MAKNKIRLTESQLVSLIRKSLLSEDDNTVPGTITQVPEISESEIKKIAVAIADKMAGDVEDETVLDIQEQLDSYIFNAKTPKGKCAMERLDIYYTSRAKEWDTWYYRGDTGPSNTLEGDLEAAKIDTPTLIKELVADIKKNKKEFCVNLSNPQKPTPPPTTTNEWACAGNYVVYGQAPDQYGEVDWNGGKLSFWLDKTKQIDGAPQGHNVLYIKGNKKWTGIGTCQKGGPGVASGLVIPSWIPFNK